MSQPTNEKSDLSVADYLRNALEDLDQARKEAEAGLRSMIDSAISHSREALDDLESDAEDRAERVRARAEERATEMQRMLEDATDDARREIGIRTVRAQQSEEALDAIADEVKHRRKEIQ